MILQCPACETRFLVDASLIPADGRKVKCSRCQHVWHVNPQDDAASAAAQSPQAEEQVSQAPTVTDAEAELVEPVIHFGKGGEESADIADEYDIPLSPHTTAVAGPGDASVMPLAALAAVLLIACAGVALFAFRDALQPTLGPVYSLMGVPRTDGLALAEVTFRERPARDKARFIVEGHIVNESAEPRQVPLLRVAIADAQGEWITAREYEADDVTLQPGESYPFKATRLGTSFVDRVDHLVVDIGSGAELTLRH